MRVPRGTYRLQLTPEFGFDRAREIAPYLRDLGISDLYLSPITQAVAGSTHGYDVADPTAVNEELGGRDALFRLHDETTRLGLGWLQDIVPNHMAFHPANRMLMDVLENGEASRYARYFDIDWNHYYGTLKGRILAPFLGKFYGEALNDGEIKVAYDHDGLWFQYYDLRFPMRAESYHQVFTHDLRWLEQRLGEHHAEFIRYLGTVHTLKNLPGPEHALERSEQVHMTKTLLWELYEGNPFVRDYVNRNLDTFNGANGASDGDSRQLLDRLMGEQCFRLAFWKVATEEINYRRFFTINGLISVRLEDEQVFHDTHTLIRELIDSGVIDGLRVDHIDGLHDPTGYLRRLEQLAPDRYVVVEKILEHGEPLPGEWPVAGTTGYDFLNTVNGVLCRRTNAPAFTRLYARYANVVEPYERLVAEKKRLMVEKHLAGNIDNLAHLLKRLSANDRYGNDITLYGLRRALVAVMSHFPVYRTYITADSCREIDADYLRQAVAAALQRHPDMHYELTYIEKFLLMCCTPEATAEEREQSLLFVMQFQQVTGPLMAKGVEDTALYVYNRLLSLNEVGGSPHVFGVTLDEFHAFNVRAAEGHPYAMNATATHDTKRGEDVRARINVLSEIPGEWDQMVKTWRRLNKRRTVRGEKAPDKNDEYFLYQALLGSWPFDESDLDTFRTRFVEYMIKAVREAKVHTTWLKHDEEYENALATYINTILSHKTGAAFLEAFLPFQRKVAWYGMLNSLSQLVIKLTAPGVPDIYQGTELWDLSMVDPDNRRSVDYAARRDLLDTIRRKAERDRAELLRDLIGSMSDGRIKLFVMHEILTARQRWESIFSEGDYTPLTAMGPQADNIIAYMRRRGHHALVTVVPRFFTELAGENEMPCGPAVWNDTSITMPLPGLGRWHNVLTGQDIRGDGHLAAADIFTRFPVALLVREEDT